MTYCKECSQEVYCRQLGRCIEHTVPDYEDMEVMRRYGEGVRELLRRHQQESEQ